MKTITSSDNPLIKTVRRLQIGRSRSDKGRFLLEGVKLAQEALASDIKIEQALVSTRFVETDPGASLITHLEKARIPWVVARERVFRRASSLETPEGVLLIARIVPRLLSSLTGELALVLAGIRDPGNLGAMARVAEAAGASALVKCRGTADPFQPKALRASMGSLIRIPVFETGEPQETLATLKHKGFRLVACLPRSGGDFRRADLSGRLALVIGNESTGLSRSLVELTDSRISVPMKDSVESLDVAVVTGLMFNEAARQRGTL